MVTVLGEPGLSRLGDIPGLRSLFNRLCERVQVIPV